MVAKRGVELDTEKKEAVVTMRTATMPTEILRNMASSSLNKQSVKFERPSSQQSSSRSKRRNRREREKTQQELEDEALEKKEMHLPYWERKEYRSYKQIKVLQPRLETSIEEYIRIKIDEQEKRLIGGALYLKKQLKATDELPHNGIMSDMIKFTHKRAIATVASQGGAHSLKHFSQGKPTGNT